MSLLASLLFLDISGEKYCLRSQKITVISSMKLISDRPGFQQRRALLIGMSVEFLNTVILTTTVPNATFRATYLYILTGVVVLLQCFFMAWLVVASGSGQIKIKLVSLLYMQHIICILYADRLKSIVTL